MSSPPQPPPTPSVTLSLNQLEVSPFFPQVLGILQTLQRYREPQELIVCLDHGIVVSGNALKFNELDREVVSVCEIFVKAVIAAPHLGPNELKGLISELDENVCGLYNECSGSTDLGDLDPYCGLAFDDLKKQMVSIVGATEAIKTRRKVFINKLQAKCALVLAGRDQLGALLEWISDESRHALSVDPEYAECCGISLYFFDYIRVHTLKKLASFDEKLSEHVVDLVLEWNRNKKED